MKSPDASTVVAKDLGETDMNAQQQIAAIVTTLGEQAALSLLERALAIEAAGGVLIPDGSRRRSAGGVFFQLARQVLSREAKQRIFYGKGQGQVASVVSNDATTPKDAELVRPTRPRLRIVEAAELKSTSVPHASPVAFEAQLP